MQDLWITPIVYSISEEQTRETILFAISFGSEDSKMKPMAQWIT